MDAPRDELEHGAANPQEAAKHVAEQVQQTVNKAKEDVQQAVGQVGENVQQTVAQVSTEAFRTVNEATRTMRETAYTVKEAASNSLLNAAENIRREAVKGGNEEAIRQAHRLARSMEKAAVYLDSHTFDQIGEAATETVKENPWQSLGIAFIIGLIIGLLFSSGRD
jgi:ElaB/YqjD/DUF883 family membrane-anchored ribosome-binding protein